MVRLVIVRVYQAGRPSYNQITYVTYTTYTILLEPITGTHGRANESNVYAGGSFSKLL